MKFVSTRGKAPALSFSEALLAGLAPDGGLYVPERFPAFTDIDFEGLTDFAAIGEKVLAPFFAGDRLAPRLGRICRAAFNFPIRLKHLDKETSVLELFHGPTAAFKDVGARFLAECIAELGAGQGAPLAVLVATSGDTGGAVAAAFHGKPGIEVVVLFPKGKVSPLQQQQLCSWGGNVRAFAVRGDFDDCQRLVKEAFLDEGWRRRRQLLSANSISVGRLLPQLVYYAASSLWYLRERGTKPGFIVPSGNLGNAMAALYAKRLGFPVREVVLATNANRSVVDFLATAKWAPHPTRATLANAMDVGNPSNLERLMHLHADHAELKKQVKAFSTSDAEISAVIRESAWGETWCPHTATAVRAHRLAGGGHWILVATAHPSKFEEVVAPLLGRKPEMPAALRELLTRPAVFTEVGLELTDLEKALG